MASKLFHIIPDASGCFIFQGRSRRDFWGPMSEIVVLENDLQKAPARFFVEFRPGGLYQISGLHQKKLVNQRQQLRYLDVQLDEELALLYQSCKDYEQLIKAFNKYFTGKRKVNLLPARLIRAKEIIDQDHGNVSLEKVASDCHLSSRQLLRDFHNYIHTISFHMWLCHSAIFSQYNGIIFFSTTRKKELFRKYSTRFQ